MIDNNETNVFNPVVCAFPEADPPNDGHIYCPPTKDYFLCWNYTLAGSTAKQLCPQRLTIVKYRNAYKECTDNGTWYIKPGTTKGWTNFQECIPSGNYHFYIYLIGYSLSVVAIVIALGILFSFKRLRCDRIRLHQNLFICHLLNATTSTAFYLLNGRESLSLVSCHILFTMITYFGVATYFWMFTEGLYLLAVLIFTFQRGKTLIIICTTIGWGVPLLLTGIFSFTRFAYENPEKCEMNPGAISLYILLVPIFISILANVVFMIVILSMLVEKIRYQPSMNSDNLKWWKAAKAILILTPLLGLYYMLVLIQPEENTVIRTIHEYMCAVAVSFQGLIVTMPFCFCNREVQDILAHWWRQKRQTSCKSKKREFQPCRKVRQSQFPQSSSSMDRNGREYILISNIQTLPDESCHEDDNDSSMM